MPLVETPHAGSVPGTQPGPRKIIHVDMDAFFASVEQRDNPDLRGKAVAVGGDPAGRGVVSAASYEARAFGVRSAMPMRSAVRLCPGLICVRPRIGRYAEVSREIMGILRRITPLVEPLSLDEAFLDVTAAGPPATELAVRIKMEIRAALGLTASAGVGPNKLVAKIASDVGKPDGLTVVRPARARVFLETLPVRRLWGVGPVTEEKLRAHGWETIGQLGRAPREQVAAVIGSFAGSLIRMAHGDDDRPVVSNRETRSISSERTLEADTIRTAQLEELLGRFSEKLEQALDREHLRARTVVLKLRYANFTTITRSLTPRAPFDSAGAIFAAGRALLGRTRAGGQPVRLIGLGLHNLAPRDAAWQPPLFAE